MAIKEVKLILFYVVEKLRNLGHDVEGRIINFSEYGVPQKRQRFILSNKMVKRKTFL